MKVILRVESNRLYRYQIEVSVDLLFLKFQATPTKQDVGTSWQMLRDSFQSLERAPMMAPAPSPRGTVTYPSVLNALVTNGR